MIPMVVCGNYGAYPPHGFAVAGLILLASVIAGWNAPKCARLPVRCLAFAIFIFAPCAAIFGIWPFDPTWRNDGGATPDPNILPIYSALVSPLIFAVTYLLSTQRLRAE